MVLHTVSPGAAAPQMASRSAAMSAEVLPKVADLVGRNPCPTTVPPCSKNARAFARVP